MNTMSKIKLGVLLLLMGCTSPTGPENQLENQRARWDAQKPHLIILSMWQEVVSASLLH